MILQLSTIKMAAIWTAPDTANIVVHPWKLVYIAYISTQTLGQNFRPIPVLVFAQSYFSCRQRFSSFRKSASFFRSHVFFPLTREREVLAMCLFYTILSVWLTATEMYKISIWLKHQVHELRGKNVILNTGQAKFLEKKTWLSPCPSTFRTWSQVVDQSPNNDLDIWKYIS